MPRIADYVQREKLTISPKVMRAGAYLEKNGQRFCCEFGFDNAEDKARELKRKRRAKLRKARERVAAIFAAERNKRR